MTKTKTNFFTYMLTLCIIMPALVLFSACGGYNGDSFNNPIELTQTTSDSGIFKNTQETIEAQTYYYKITITTEKTYTITITTPNADTEATDDTSEVQEVVGVKMYGDTDFETALTDKITQSDTNSKGAYDISSTEAGTYYIVIAYSQALSNVTVTIQ